MCSGHKRKKKIKINPELNRLNKLKKNNLNNLLKTASTIASTAQDSVQQRLFSKRKMKAYFLMIPTED
jgi:hypothetical protein